MMLRPAISDAFPSILNDPFNLLPDSLLLCIFNRVLDVKALGRCFAVCRRFNYLVLQVEDVVVKVDSVISTDESNASLRGKGLLTHLYRVFVGSLVKPLHVLQHFLAPRRYIIPEVSHHSPRDVLRIFKGVKRLRIELPGGELGIEDGTVLKWRAEFGSTLEKCVILAASSLLKSDKDKLIRRMLSASPASRAPITLCNENQATVHDSNSSIPESFFTNGGLKLRVVWTISSLIAASTRHYLLQQIIGDHPSLESLVLADLDGQGMLCMNKQQILDFRGKPIAASASSTNRTQVPALTIKLWYAPLLDLPGGHVMKGATLVAIRPSGYLEGLENFPTNAFEEPFSKAAGLLARRRTYSLEMNSF